MVSSSVRDVVSWPFHGGVPTSPLTTVATWPFKRCWSYISLWVCASVVWISGWVDAWRDVVTIARQLVHSPLSSVTTLVTWSESALATHYHHWPLAFKLFWREEPNGTDEYAADITFFGFLNPWDASVEPPSPSTDFKIFLKKRRRRCFEEDPSTVCLACRSAIRQRHSTHTRPSAE